jgi:aryl-phospho-beta-D-glucosidase BglC (GH1 family)
LLVVSSSTARAQLPTPTYGWNLGNTLEPPSGEGTWGPAATQAMINAVADSGFNTIRLPVAWNSHANQSTYVIDPAWMARVKQVVDWCYAKNLTVIVNCHWDGGWLENNITDTVNPTINAKMQSYWTLPCCYPSLHPT